LVHRRAIRIVVRRGTFSGAFAYAEIVGAVGNIYVRRGLSPPAQLHSAAKHWLGLSVEEIIDAIERHFDEHRRRYTSGSGDGLFWMVEAAVRKAWREKHPSIDRTDDERPRWRRSRGVRKVHNAGGIPDLIIDGGRAASLLRDCESNVERPSGLAGL
jgi:hypothetical protein